MTAKFEILTNFIKDMSSETPDLKTYLHVKDKIPSYQLNIQINTKPLKNRMIEVNTLLSFSDKEQSEIKSYFEIVYVSIIKIDENVKDKKDIEKIVLCDLQKIIYPKIEKIFLNILNDSGYPGIKIEKKIDFEQLYKERSK
tara:strand:- start:28 stop:450 length:423 start_codon:yes stop_codon:yes gene_type:complete